MPKKTNIEINGSNYYRTTATIGRDANGKPIRKQFYGSSKKEAEQKRDEYLLNINKGLSVGYDKALFRSVFSEWFESVLRPSVAMSSYKRYETDYRLRIRDCNLANFKLTDIKAINIQSFYNELLETNTVNTVINVNKLLSNFFTYCVKSDLILRSPLNAVELPKEKGIKKDTGALSNDDISKLITATKDDMNNFIFVFAVFSGLRQGEILSLTHNDINFENNTISVNKTVNFFTVDGKYSAVLSAPKTKTSVREVPILAEIKPLLNAHMKNEMRKFLKLGIPFNKDCILFSSTAGGYIEPGNLRKRLKRLYKKLEINQSNFHIMRHTFCSLLAKNGVPLKTASMLMGHSDIGITARIYTHVDNKELQKGIDTLAGFFN